MAVFGTINNILPTFTLITALTIYILFRVYKLEEINIRDKKEKYQDVEDTNTDLGSLITRIFEDLRTARTIWGVFVLETVFLSALYITLITQVMTENGVQSLDYLAYFLGGFSLLAYFYVETSYGDIFWIPHALYDLNDDNEAED